jgi:uncharacterized protein (TIRG00374 family)
LGALANISILFAGHAGLGALPKIQHPLLLLLAAGLAMVDWVTNSLRLRLWSRFTGHPLPFLSCLRVFLGSILAQAATPTATGATLFKGMMLAEEGVPGPAAVSLVAIETVEDMLFFILFLPVAFALGATGLMELIAHGVFDQGVKAMIIAFSVMAAAIVLLRLAWVAACRGAFGPRGRRLADRVKGAVSRILTDVRRVYGLIIRRGKARFALAMGLTTIQWGARYSVAALVIAALGGPFHFFLFAGLQWLVFTFATVVPTPGGTGALEGAYALFYAPFLRLPLLASSVALWRLILFYVPIALGALAFLWLQRRRARLARGKAQA